MFVVAALALELLLHKLPLRVFKVGGESLIVLSKESGRGGWSGGASTSKREGAAGSAMPLQACVRLIE